MNLTDNSGTLLFQQVADQLAEMIRRGEVKEGEQIPSTTEISTSYHINPATVLKGMNLLVEGGYITKQRGLGMFVVPGAQARLVAAASSELLDRQLTDLARQARELGIPADRLLTIIHQAYAG